jgi:lipoate synthase
MPLLVLLDILALKEATRYPNRREKGCWRRKPSTMLFLSNNRQRACEFSRVAAARPSLG